MLPQRWPKFANTGDDVANIHHVWSSSTPDPANFGNNWPRVGPNRLERVDVGAELGSRSGCSTIVGQPLDDFGSVQNRGGYSCEAHFESIVGGVRITSRFLPLQCYDVAASVPFRSVPFHSVLFSSALFWRAGSDVLVQTESAAECAAWLPGGRQALSRARVCTLGWGRVFSSGVLGLQHLT